MSDPTFRISSTALGTSDPRGLAAFYRELLGWEVRVDEAEWVVLKPADSPTGLAFQLEESHNPPSWPAGPGDQQMQSHLDIGVLGSLRDGVQRAEALGAVRADQQPQDDVCVMFDPAGHPFCLFATG